MLRKTKQVLQKPKRRPHSLELSRECVWTFLNILQVSQIEASTPESEAKALLLDDIDNFIQEKVTFADEQIARTAQSKVDSGDVVLTYAYSSAVLSTFLQAKQVINFNFCSRWTRAAKQTYFCSSGGFKIRTPFCLSMGLHLLRCTCSTQMQARGFATNVPEGH